MLTLISLIGRIGIEPMTKRLRVSFLSISQAIKKVQLQPKVLVITEFKHYSRYQRITK